MTTTPATPDPLADAMRRLTPMDPTEALRRLQVLVQSQPNLRALNEEGSCPSETLKWLGELHAVVRAMKRVGDEVPLQAAVDKLVRSQGSRGSEEIRTVLYRALAAAELEAPASEQGAFIAAGAELDAYAAISKVLSAAKSSLLVVDPYMDGKALSDFMPSAAEGVHLGILSDEATAKPTLGPAIEKWKSQFGDSRPIEVRLAPGRALHDRLILVDEGDAWSLSQSLKDFAQRAHGSVLKADPEIAVRKVAAYTALWKAARPL
jgi:hypothetical protein